MKAVFPASLIHCGILGGGLYVDEDKVLYRTNKLTVEEKLRYLRMRYEEIEGCETIRKGIVPLVHIRMKNKEEHTFLVFGRKKFLKLLEENRRNVQGRKLLQSDHKERKKDQYDTSKLRRKAIYVSDACSHHRNL